MACCAFAAFVVSQIVFAFMGLRERLFGAADPERAGAAPNLAAAWRLGDPAPAVAPARSAIPLRVAVAVGAGALAFGLTFAVMNASASHADAMSVLPASFLCIGGPIP
jgi:hypothetical protein